MRELYSTELNSLCMHVIYGGARASSGGDAVRYVLPVLWMAGVFA